MKIAPNDPFKVPHEMSEAGGDFDPTTPSPCVNKFCAAKQVVHDTLPQFATEARIGLASYMQFLVRQVRQSSQLTRCYYDKMWVAGYAGPDTEFLSVVDHTGSGPIFPSSSPLPVFPSASVASAHAGNLFGRCDQTSAASRYTVEKIGVNVTSVSRCALFGYDQANLVDPSPPVPMMLAGAQSGYGLSLPPANQCIPGSSYTSKGPSLYHAYSAPPPVNAATYGNYTVQHVPLATPGCPATAIMGAGPPMAPASVILSGPVPVGTAVGQWEGIGAMECNDQPCDLFSVDVNTTQTAPFQTKFSLTPQTYVPLPAAPANTQSETHVEAAAPLVASRTLQAPVCPFGPVSTTTTISNGSATWSTFGVTPAMVAPGQFAVPAAPDSNITPAWADPACTADLPCTVTLTAENAHLVWSAWQPINYNIPGPGPNEQIQVRSVSGSSPLDNLMAKYRRALSEGSNNCNGWSAAIPGPIISSAGGGDANRWINATLTGTSYVPTGCGALRNRCEMQWVDLVSMSNGCPASLDTFDGTGRPNACVSPYNGSGYSYSNTPTVTPATFTINFAPGTTDATCTGLSGTNRTRAMDSGSPCPATCATKLSSTQSPCQCRIESASPSAGPLVPSAKSYDRTSAPACPSCVNGATYSGAPARTLNLASLATCLADNSNPGCTWKQSLPCGTGQLQSNDAVICGSSGTPCTVTGYGLQAWGPVTAEEPQTSCLYVRQAFEWDIASKSCALTIEKRTWPINDGDMPVCRYDQKVYEYRTQDPYVDCTYTTQSQRHRYEVLTDKVCRYARMRTTYEAPAYEYAYRWVTKGGELVSSRSTAFNDVDAPWQPTGEHVETAAGAWLCATPYTAPTGFAGNQCPETINNCGGNPQHVCKLRWGAPLAAGPGSGRYQLAKSRDSRMCLAPDYGPATDPWHVAADPSAAIILGNTALGDGTNDGTGSCLGAICGAMKAATACQQAGQSIATAYRLYSDWYEPGLTNGGPLTPADPRLGAPDPLFDFDAWTNQPSKESGWGATGGNGALFPAGLPTESLGYLPIPEDGAPDNAVALRQAMSKCVLPGTANVNATMQWSRQGFCMAEDYFRNGPGTGLYDHSPIPTRLDFTPLNGALQNTYQYLSAMRDVDLDAECRDYFVVLATDGKEDTPAGFTGADLVSSVQQLKDHVPALAASNTRGIRTYVIGFGDGAMNPATQAQLDAMAAAGGTGAAYTAANQAALQTALSLVFSQITSGTFSRSKPAISTDGARVYASSFVRGLTATASPEWQGHLDAYQIDPSTGALTHRWEYSSKLNSAQQIDAARALYTNDNAFGTVPFSTATAFLTNPLSSPLCTDVVCTTLKGVPPPSYASFGESDIISFVRNPGVPSAAPAKYLAANPAPTRLSRAGAIEHSSAVVVGKSAFSSDWGGAPGPARTAYQSWQASTLARPTRILVGSSDGLLRGIIDRTGDPNCAVDENDPACPNGREAWGWVPWEVLPNLYKTMMTNQKNVDNTMAVTDACGTVSGVFPALTTSDAATCTQAEWFTLGIGSMRQGGRSLFALRIEDDGAFHTGPSSFMWNFSSPNLGETWSVPAVGRARLGGADKFVAVFGGGLDCSPSCAGAGDSVFAVDAVSGVLIDEYVGGGPVNLHHQSSLDEIPARPAMFRRPLDPYLNSVVMGTRQGQMYVMRFENPAGGSQYNAAAQWTPTRFFDPADGNDRKNINNVQTPIMTIKEDTSTSPPTYTLEQVSCGVNVAAANCDATLPLVNVAPPPLFNRAKVATIYDASGNTADYYVGTGNGLDPIAAPTVENFFYALHDRNQQDPPPNPKHDGVPLWVVRFPNPKEQVVSEPVITQGDIVVATFIPPTSASACALAGDTVLYAFNPKSGALVPSIVIPNSMPGGGSKTAVLRLSNVGIPSDLLQIGRTLTFNTSQGGLMQAGHEPPMRGGDIRSFRRVR